MPRIPRSKKDEEPEEQPKPRRITRARPPAASEPVAENGGAQSAASAAAPSSEPQSLAPVGESTSAAPTAGARDWLPADEPAPFDDSPTVGRAAGGAPASEPRDEPAPPVAADEPEPREPAEVPEPTPPSPQPSVRAREPEPQPESETSPISVVSEPAPEGEEEEEYRWHTGVNRPTGVPDAIEFIDVHKAFGRNKILRGLNMGLPEGKISMILGPSGTGKSVCIKHMVGLLYPDEGDVLIHGESVPNMVDDELFEMRKKFGVLFQDGALFGSMNLYDNVAFPLRQHTDKSEDEIADVVNSRLREVGLGNANDKMPNELSGGMRKRAGFARALVLDPGIVLFDEPDSGLDPVRTALLCELIKEIHEENGGAYVVITHDIMSARRVAEHIAVLWKGRIVEAGPAEDLFNSDNAFVRQFLSGEAQGPLGME
jgi:phospholipid/cholesterol/gamma-HCH transport system ATP-binding protein